MTPENTEAESFDLVFRGDVVIGEAVSDVKLRLQQLFKVDSVKVETLFSGRPVALKRNLDRATAEKYQQVLRRAGAQVSLVNSAPTRTPSPAPSASPQPRTDSGLSLAPMTGYLVKPEEQRRLTPVDVDTSGLSLRPASGYLIDSEEQSRSPVVELEVPDLNLAEAGADLLTEEERQGLPVMLVEPEDWGLAEPGSDLLSEHERGVKAIPPKISADFELAPPGSDMGQQKDTRKALNPDTSGLRLADQ